jgi:hypothetical protein
MRFGMTKSGPQSEKRLLEPRTGVAPTGVTRELVGMHSPSVDPAQLPGGWSPTRSAGVFRKRRNFGCLLQWVPTAAVREIGKRPGA